MSRAFLRLNLEFPHGVFHRLDQLCDQLDLLAAAICKQFRDPTVIIRTGLIHFDTEQFISELKYGSIKQSELKCPGVYFLRMEPPDGQARRCLYIVTEEAPINDDFSKMNAVWTRFPVYAAAHNIRGILAAGTLSGQAVQLDSLKSVPQVFPIMYTTAPSCVFSSQDCGDIVQDAVESLCKKHHTLMDLPAPALPVHIVYTVKNQAKNFNRHQAVV